VDGVHRHHGGTASPPVQFYNPSALYALTPVSEAIARAVASRTDAAPVPHWELPRPDGEDGEEGDLA
jgi:hypothetical protein